MKTAEVTTDRHTNVTAENRSMNTPRAPRSDNAAIRALLAQWNGDASDYDEQVWPLVKVTIEENRLTERKRFSDAAPAV